MNLRQHVFVTEYLRSADHIQAYKNAYNSTSNFKTIESAANRLLRQPDIAKAISDTQTAIRLQVEDELKSQLKRELLTIQQKRELLAQIATGEMYAEQHYKGKNCSQCTQYVKPTINQMLKAIDLDNKLAGHYSYQLKRHPSNSLQRENVVTNSSLEGGARQSSGGGCSPAQDKTQQKTSPAGEDDFEDSLSRFGGSGGTITTDKSNASTPPPAPLPPPEGDNPSTNKKLLIPANTRKIKPTEITTNHNKKGEVPLLFLGGDIEEQALVSVLQSGRLTRNNQTIQAQKQTNKV